jgi:ABC-type multidrug transport system fused ATPase/permease subunit
MMALREKWRQTTIGRSARVLSRSDQKKILLVMILQIAMGALDLIGVAIIGILGALAVSGVESRQPGNRVSFVLKLLHIDGLTFQNQAAVLGATATIILISRTIFSILFTRRTMFFLSRRGATISSHLVSKLLSQSLLKIQEKTSQETIYAVTTGVNAITLGVLGTTVSLVSDSSLLVVMAIGLFVVDPTIALSTALVFGIIGLAMYKLMHKRAQRLGSQEAVLSIASNEKISEVLNSYRESVVRNRRDYYAREIGGLRLNLANTLAEIAFMPNISKYVIETTMVLGALLISAIQFMLQDATHAVATLSVFLAAGTRIAPAVLRVQQGSIVIKGSLGTAGPTLDLIESLGDLGAPPRVSDEVDVDHLGFTSKVEISSVTLTYPGKPAPAIRNINLSVNPGESVAFVGSSGAGKTTLVDVLLGVLTPQSGAVEISGLTPLETVSKWPGAISYVPQDVTISNGTIRENVALGFPAEAAHDDLVWNAIETAQLSEFVKSLPQGLDTPVGERGTKISGGQRQRLGIARAMFTQPKLLVLDEATSSLDGQTEYDISEAIQGLKGRVTVIMIAHRLSTVRNADTIIYLNSGEIQAQGTFEEVRQAVPDFNRQAELMGL